MRRLTFLLGVMVWAGAAFAGEPVPTFEPVSGLFYLNLAELNGLLEQNDFPKIASTIALTGGWTRVRTVEWLPLGLSIAEGSVRAERGERRVSFNLFYFSAFVDRRWVLSERIPALRAFASGGLGVGTATLLLGVRAMAEDKLEDILQTGHDTLLRRIFFSVVPRVGIEFVLTDAITLRASFGYIGAPWSGAWEHFSERVSGPPRDFSGFLVEFTISYKMDAGLGF
jgi:hypothetical protein